MVFCPAISAGNTDWGHKCAVCVWPDQYIGLGLWHVTTCNLGTVCICLAFPLEHQRPSKPFGRTKPLQQSCHCTTYRCAVHRCADFTLRGLRVKNLSRGIAITYPCPSSGPGHNLMSCRMCCAMAQETWSHTTHSPILDCFNPPPPPPPR